jgi:hypothetical protein
MQIARHRLEVLWADTTSGDLRSERILTFAEVLALRAVLDELHRLNLVVSLQEARLRAARNRGKRK